ncbi:uncharacterized protein HMPREF1541_05209 [Cyphellophora europaea CBS 101466]|uniref:Major facilitator superfamily (MFS) profile domain-containing protein n=1 Tax=Cyphellophora europaea (strain CBS 101466) TaxID=1220924 RepID=W2RZ37_CYPE1|nr:uncharacterized protein HMPREF1541_05209 [Cyphellophora europaea CBS 101466]ETN40929.1 hypothetical protein HMPREF1541_05209 [Cyphellophora europaea CBS 101466]
MAVQVRDTHFGRFVRFISCKRLLQYPDELDPTLANAFTLSGQPRSDELLKKEACDGVDLQNDASQPPKAAQRFYLVDWYGPDDPENPQNWSSSWKLLVATLICVLNFTVYVASSIYVPGEESLMQEFGVGEVVATLGLSFFSLGYGLGPMVLSPLSEFPTLGRNPVYFYSLLTFVLLQLPTGYAVNMPMFCVFRLITGFFSSPALATGGATLADMYHPKFVAYGICIWGSCGLLGPVAGPLIGGYIATAKDWRWTIWFVAWLNALLLILYFFLMPETSAANILYKRAVRLRAATRNERLRSKSEIDAAQHTWRDHLRVLGRAFTLTFTEPIVFALDLYTALLYGVLFIWFESFPLVFGDIYGFSIRHQGLVFLGILVFAIFSVPAFLLWVRWGIVPRVGSPNFKPEMVLPPTFVGSLALPVCLFWYGWTARESVHWIVPIVGSGWFTVAIVTLFNPVMNYLGMVYPDYAASVFAGNALFRASFGAIFPLFARQLFRNLGIGPGNSLLGGISILFLPMPFLFYMYGDRIRLISKNARHDNE